MTHAEDNTVLYCITVSSHVFRLATDPSMAVRRFEPCRRPLVQAASVILHLHDMRVPPIRSQECKIQRILSLRYQIWKTIAASKQVKITRHQKVDQLTKGPFGIVLLLDRLAKASPREVGRSPQHLRLGSQPCMLRHSREVLKPSRLVSPEVWQCNWLAAGFPLGLFRC